MSLLSNSEAPETLIQMYFRIRKEFEFGMPPVGLSKNVIVLAGKRFTRYTYHCPVEGCWYVCHGSETIINQNITHHNNKDDNYNIECPTPPRRESLPSGNSEIEKLWREMDDIVDAIYNGDEYRKMTGEILKAYATGISFSIVMKEVEFFPDIKSVAIHAAERRQMRLGTRPYKRTPTRTAPKFSSTAPENGLFDSSPVVHRPKRSKLTDKIVAAIKRADETGMMTREDMKEMWDVTYADIDYALST